MKDIFRVCTLYSGSSGNCAYIRVGESAILIDAGKSARAVCRGLEQIGESISNIDAIFVTHEHIDHIAGLEVLSKKYAIPVYMTEPSATVFDAKPDSAVHSVLRRQTSEFCVELGDMRVTSFRTSHDSKMSVGYRIDAIHSGKRCAIGYATDTGYVTDEVKRFLTGCSAVIVECNHDEEMVKTGPYPYPLKQRILSSRGHMSNKACAELVSQLTESGTRSVLLAHLSRENNDPCLALETVQRAVCDKAVCLRVADPCRAVEIPIMLEGVGVDA